MGGMEENGTNQMEFFEVTAGGRAANGDEWPLDVEVMIKPASGAFYVADTENHAVRRIDRTTGLIRTVAGVIGSYGTVGDRGRANRAELYSPTGVAVDAAARRLYVADSSNHAVRVVVVTGDVRTSRWLKWVRSRAA